MDSVDNPYCSPQSPAADIDLGRNQLGSVSLALSIAGLVALFLAPVPILGAVAPPGSLLCPLGALAGVMSVSRAPRRASIWAIMVGIFGSMYIPTIWLSWFISR